MTRCETICASIVALLGVVAAVTAQERVVFDHISSRDGLSGNRVVAITQDHIGFMWFGTINGLNRYDGYDFKIFGNEPDDPNSVSEGQIRSLYVDRAGVVWVGTWSAGLNRYNAATENFERYAHDPDDPESLSGNHVSGMYEDSNGTFWVSTIAGLNELDRATGRFKRYVHDANDPNNPNRPGAPSVGRIVEDETGALWIPTSGGGVSKLLPQKPGESERVFVHYRADPEDPTSLSHNTTRALYLDSVGDLWVATWGGGLNRMDRETETFTHYRHDPNDPHSLVHDQVSSILEDAEGSLWVATNGNGLERFDRRSETFTHFRHDPLDDESLSHDQIVGFYQDDTGAFWIGTLGGGINVLDPNKRAFVRYENDPDDPESEGKDDVRGVHFDGDDTLWFGTLGDGLVKLDRKNRAFTHYRHDPKNPESLSNNGVWAVFADEESVWVGGLGGLSRLDRVTEAFENFRHDPNDPTSLDGTVVLSVYRDRSGALWVGTFGGLNRFDEENRTFVRDIHDPQDPNSLANDAVTGIIEDRSGALWLSTWGDGLKRFDPQTERVDAFQNDPDDPESLGHDSVFSLHESIEGTIWAGTTAGLSRMVMRDPPAFVRYTERDGLPDRSMQGILEDDAGNLWISTNRGLSRFDPRTETFFNFDVSDGLQGSIYSPMDAYAKSPGGYMVFGGVNGFDLFHPDEIATNQRIPPVVLTDFRLARRPVPIGNDSVLTRSIVQTPALTLSYEDRVLSFEFAALDFRAPRNNRYRYRLEGLEADWTEVGSEERTVTYMNLRPGDYTFRVRGSNNHGVWNEQGVSLQLTVTPPWWQSWWFRGLSFVSIAFVLFSAHELRIRIVEQQKRVLESEVEERKKVETVLKDVAGRLITAQEAERKRIARELHDDLNQKIAALAIDLSRVDGELTPSNPTVHDEFVNLEERTTSLSEDVRRISHRLHPATIEHVGLAAGLKSLCHELSAENEIAVDFDLHRGIKPPTPDVALSLYRITQEAFQNIRKHSGASQIRVILEEQEEPPGLALTIADDGVGFDASRPESRKGLGLVSMEERARLLDGTIHIESSPGSGTVLHVWIPRG